MQDSGESPLPAGAAGAQGPLFTGALVGWETRPFDGRLVLRLQGVNRSPPHRHEDVSEFYLVMNRQQALQLGENLFAMVDSEIPARPRRNWLVRLLAP